jgi:sugar phosphate isomerase/epimerase
MQLGCNTSMFNQLDLYGALQHIAWAGFDGAELASIVPARHLELNTNKSYINEVKSLATKLGLQLFAIHSEEEGETDEENIKLLAKLCDVAHQLNIPVVAPFIRRKAGDKEEIKQNFKYIKQLGEQAESRGVTLAIGIHAGTPVGSTEMAIRMLNELDSPALGINLDTRELSKAGEDPSEAVIKLGRKIVHVYFRDYPYKQQSEVTPEQEIPGRSEVDFPKILRHLKDVNYNGVIDVMLEGVWTYPLTKESGIPKGNIPANAWTYPVSRQMGMVAEARGYLNRCLQEVK